VKTGQQHQLYDFTPFPSRARAEWPGGARLALWIVPNIEHYELTAPDGSVDVPSFSRSDYANRVGVWRIMELLDRHGMRGTVALNSAVCAHYPQVIEACLKRGWELMGHGITNSESLANLPPEDEAALIRRAIGRELERTDDPGVAIVKLHAAIDVAFGSAPHLAEGSAYVDDIRRRDADRETLLGARRHRGRPA